MTSEVKAVLEDLGPYIVSTLRAVQKAAQVTRAYTDGGPGAPSRKEALDAAQAAQVQLDYLEIRLDLAELGEELDR